MALIKGLTLSFILLIWAALLAQSFASDDAVLLEEFRKSIARNIHAEMTDQFRADLKDSGLSPADVDRIVADLEESIESCFVDTTIKYAQVQDIPLADLITEEDGYYTVGFKGNEGAEFGELLAACTNAARAEAGIAMK